MHELLFATAITLPTAPGYDLSLMSLQESQLDLGSVESLPSCIRVEENGSSIFITGFSSDTIRRYQATTPYSTLNANLQVESLSVSAQEGTPVDITFINGGSTLLLGGFSGSIHQYNLTTPYSLNTGSFSGTSLSVAGRPTSMEFNQSEDVMLISNIEGSIIRYNLSTAGDITTAVQDANSLLLSDIISGFSVAYALRVNTDGTRLFVMGFNQNVIYQIDLSIPYDLSSATYSGVELSAPGDLSSAYALEFADEGRSMYTTGSGSQILHRYESS